MNKFHITTALLTMLTLTFCLVASADTARDKKEKKIKCEAGKKQFLEICIKISESNYSAANAMAEKLIKDYAGDYQIYQYLGLYGMLPPERPEVSTKVKKLKAKKDKTVLDLVKLARTSDYYVNPEYLTLILQKHPDSIWAQWAEFELGALKFRKRKKPIDKQMLTDACKYIDSFMQKYPDTYLMPHCISHYAFARWDERINKDDEEAKQDAIRMFGRILVEYPEAEFYCVEARLELKKILGESYSYPEGHSEENDRIIRKCYGPPNPNYKKNVAKYKKIADLATEKKGT